MINSKRLNFTIKIDIEKKLRHLSNQTGLKMSTIVENGILLLIKEYEKKSSQ